jgi:hypothetical protein
MNKEFSSFLVNETIKYIQDYGDDILEAKQPKVMQRRAESQSSLSKGTR